MPRAINRLIPSMFHRRLAFLLLGAGAVTVLLCLQLWNLTVVHGAADRQRAELPLEANSVIPTIRGRIFDRGSKHVLAMDEPSYDVAVRFPVITGEWAAAKAGLVARASVGAKRWMELSPEEREAVRAKYIGAYNKQIEQLWSTLCDLTQTPRQDLEERKASITGRIERLKSYLGALHLADRSAELDEPLQLSDVIEPNSEEAKLQTIVFDIPDSARLQIERYIGQAAQDPTMAVWGQVAVADAKKRVYPQETQTITLDRSTLPSPLRSDQPTTITVEGVGTHVLGLTRRILKEELEDPSGRWKGYEPDDRVGAFGIERAQESRLRGTPGYEIRNLETGSVTRQDPIPGSDVVLSIDIELQARVEAIMDPRPVSQGGLGLMRQQSWYQHETEDHRESRNPLDEPLNGAAVVLDVSSGQVLAAVSVPTMSLRVLRDSPQTITNDTINTPYVNRVVSMPYEPGSTVKPLVLAAAMTDHKIGPGDTVDCSGQLYPGGPRCWTMTYYGAGHGHGPLDGVEAITQSCDVFFYTMGERLGAKRLVWWYDRYNLGRPTGCGLDEEVGADLPNLANADKPNARGFAVNDAVYMGIGQGPVRWTALQAANAYAALARGGYMVSPTFLALADGTHEQTTFDLHLDPAGIDNAMKGIYGAVHDDNGTCKYVRPGPGLKEEIFNIPGVTIYGKSGTAEAAPLKAMVNGSKTIVRQGSHAWFIAMVQRPGSSRPDYVVAVVVAYAGSGGATAGPIVNQILYALRAGNYL